MLSRVIKTLYAVERCSKSPVLSVISKLWQTHNRKPIRKEQPLAKHLPVGDIHYQELQRRGSQGGIVQPFLITDWSAIEMSLWNAHMFNTNVFYIKLASFNLKYNNPDKGTDNLLQPLNWVWDKFTSKLNDQVRQHSILRWYKNDLTAWTVFKAVLHL